ncbi:TetR/AcrR family transcriptional regulator [uncultured Tateyamaria sp.]|uniref:TetR/AcrR family transcriptional regulator n=1 Tax=uncultured Tateyamaria sp. TaxID=455651 RepID=UPI0026243D12|nr:TetR/AcrR family transcriptional regulator [uncultured Tateyamaria sp.]
MPKIVDREEMQNGILNAAMEVYIQKGFHTATIADVAEGAGVAKGTLYLYFKNKESIAVAIVDRHFERLQHGLMGQEDPDTLDEFMARLDNSTTVKDEATRFIRLFYEMFGPNLDGDPVVSRLGAFFDQLGQNYERQLKHLRDRKEVNQDIDPEHLGRAIASLVDGLILHRGLFNLPKARHGKIRAEALSMVRRGLVPA